jgi:hypothetical protein
MPTEYPTDADLKKMLAHWSNTPENGYLGSSYGFRDRLRELLSSECTPTAAEEVLNKMYGDLPHFGKAGARVHWNAADGYMTVATSDSNIQVTAPSGA